MGSFIQKIKQTRILYIELLFTLFAFIVMVFLSYHFMGTIVHRGLVRSAVNLLDFEEERVSSKLHESTAMLESVSGTIRNMILRGDSVDMLQDYINDFSNYLCFNVNHTAGACQLRSQCHYCLR